MKTWRQERHDNFQRHFVADVWGGIVNAIRQYGPLIALVALGFALGWL